jgi:uridine phosphorylase
MKLFNIKAIDFYKEPSLLKASDLVAWKRKRGAYNFKELPDLAIIAIKRNMFSKVISPFTKRAKGINGSHFIYKSKVLLCSEFGSGASAMIMLLEELRALGVRQFIFIGSAGILDDSVKEGSAHIVQKAVSLSGTTFFYSEKDELECYDLSFFEKVKNKCNLTPKTILSTDSPFRETPSLIDHYKSKGCALVDMECASIYAFSQFYKIPSACILVGADTLTSSEWKAPNNIKNVLIVQQKIVLDLLKL